MWHYIACPKCDFPMIRTDRGYYCLHCDLFEGGATMMIKKAVEILEIYINTGELPPDDRDFAHAVFLGLTMLKGVVELEDAAQLEIKRLAADRREGRYDG